MSYRELFAFCILCSGLGWEVILGQLVQLPYISIEGVVVFLVDVLGSLVSYPCMWLRISLLYYFISLVHEFWSCDGFRYLDGFSDAWGVGHADVL